MKIWLAIDFEPIPGLDGASRYLRYGMLANHLAAAGHDVTWWTSDFDHFAKKHRNGPSNRQIKSNLTVRMLHGKGYGKNISLSRVHHNRSVAQSFIAAMDALPSNSHPDVVMVCLHTLELAEAVTQFTNARDISTVVDVVDVWPEVYLRAFPSVLKGIARLCLTAEFRRAKHILGRADLITAVSQTYLDWARALCGEVSVPCGEVYPLGYDDDDVDELAVRAASRRLQDAYNITPDSLNLVFVGQLSHSYDLSTVVAAAKLLHPSLREKVRYIIAGDGVGRPQLERETRDLPTVKFTGWLSHADVTALLRLCNVGLVSYASDATQSLPYKPFEYMASGLALLSCLQGEMADLINQKRIGLQYSAGSAWSLAESIRYLAGNPKECDAMRMEAKNLFKEAYRAATIYSQLVNRLEKIARKKPLRQSL